MIKTIISDFARVILFANDTVYRGSLSRYYQQLAGQKTAIFDSYRIDTEYLAALKKYQTTHQLVLLTASETLPKHLQIAPKLRSIFEPILFTKSLGVSKDVPVCYTKVCQMLQIDPPQAVFIDDSAANVAAATTAGLYTIQYTDRETTLDTLKTILHDHSNL